ncbi:hypothetical protein KY290_001398 [Solanum tuberosum]|uniref:Integrase core domain containing protein n=1 Tax=Solanum tuberosum TaxID=4113 RepID=A0ABQ7WPC1_SOLTU|nr:hypothetical protein KY290_001398 [Solanum tuberosum]
MSHRRKNVTKPAPITALQSEGHDDYESSSSEDTLPQSEDGGSSSGSGEDSRSKSDAASGSQSADNSGGSAKSESGSQEDVTTPPPVINKEVETGVREEADATEEDIEITIDDTMVTYVNMHEPNPAARHQLIDCYRSMWTINRSEEFFSNGIVNKTGGFKKRAIMHETRVVVADIKSFLDIYRIFQLHQFDWMDNAPGEYSSHLEREFYSSYVATLMNFVAEIETTKCGQKDTAITLGPFNSIIVWGKSIDISEATINRMMHGPKYSAPASVGAFEGKHDEVTSDTTMED